LVSDTDGLQVTVALSTQAQKEFVKNPNRDSAAAVTANTTGIPLLEVTPSIVGLTALVNGTEPVITVSIENKGKKPVF
jgi:hypothetical protein